MLSLFESHASLSSQAFLITFVSDISSASSPNVSFSLQMTLEFTSKLRRYPKVDRYDSLCWCKITKMEEFHRIPLYHRLSPCHQNGWMSSWKRITRRSPSDLAHQAALSQTPQTRSTSSARLRCWPSHKCHKSHKNLHIDKIWQAPDLWIRLSVLQRSISWCATFLLPWNSLHRWRERQRERPVIEMFR